MSKPEKTDKKFRDHFWSQVKKHGRRDCWIWTGLRDGRGYGAIWRSGKKHRVHRVSFEFKGSVIPDGMLVCHHCDNKLCVNPKHLFVGTHKDNMQDWTRKGKNILINHPELLPRGNNHWTRKKTTKTKLELKKISLRRKQEWKDGRRKAIRDKRGRIMGTRMVAQ